MQSISFRFGDQEFFAAGYSITEDFIVESGSMEKFEYNKISKSEMQENAVSPPKFINNKTVDHISLQVFNFLKTIIPIVAKPVIELDHSDNSVAIVEAKASTLPDTKSIDATNKFEKPTIERRWSIASEKIPEVQAKLIYELVEKYLNPYLTGKLTSYREPILMKELKKKFRIVEFESLQSNAYEAYVTTCIKFFIKNSPEIVESNVNWTGHLPLKYLDYVDALILGLRRDFPELKLHDNDIKRNAMASYQACLRDYLQTSIG